MEKRTCVLCGAELPEKASKNRRYCDVCREVVTKGRTEEHRSPKNEKRKQEQSSSPIPKVGEGKSLSQMAKEAHELGLTYGQYSSLLASGGLKQYLKHHKPKRIAQAKVRPTKMW